MVALAALLAFVIGLGVAFVAISSLDFRRTYTFLFRSSRAFYLHGLIYGAVAGGALIAADYLEGEGRLVIGGAGSNIWLQAIVVGLSARAFLHLRILEVTVGDKTLPLGLETILQIFEPWLIENIRTDEFNAVRAFAEPFATAHPTLKDVKTLMKENVPPGLPAKVFEAEIEKASTVVSAMEVYIRFAGRPTFDRVFGAD